MSDQFIELFKLKSRSSKIDSCLLNLSNLNKLYKILEEKVSEAVEIEIKEFIRPINMTDIEFDNIKNEINRVLKLCVTIIGTKGEQIVGYNNSILAIDTFPDDIQFIIFENISLFKSVAKREPLSKFEIKFDFTKPVIFDFSNPLFQQYQNTSLINIIGKNETWVDGLYQSIITFLGDKKKNRNWLHSKYIHDLLLYIIIWPIIFWSIYRFQKLNIINPDVTQVIFVAIYIYFFLILYFTFRIIFNYSKWVFPLIEYNPTDGSKMFRHRALLSAILIAISARLIWDIVKNIY